MPFLILLYPQPKDIYNLDYNHDIALYGQDENISEEIVNVCAPMLKSDIDELKIRTKADSNKEAIRTAVKLVLEAKL